MLLLFWWWLARRLRTPAEWEHRRQRGHPWLFMLALGTAVASFADGAILSGVGLVVAAVVLVVL